jgi:general secretion pathway protein N
MNRFCAMVGLAACVAAVGGPPWSGSATTSPVTDGPIGNPISHGALEPAPELGRPMASPELARPMTSPELARPVGAVARERAPIGNPLWAVPLRSLSVTRERPIFSPSRRPPPPAVVAPVTAARPPPPPPAEPDHPSLTLVGTVIGDGGGIGVFLDQATKAVIRLRTGQDHDGWTLRKVRGREAIFDKDRRTASLELPPPGGGPSAQPGIPVPVGAPVANTWMDGDGQMVAPPPRAAQTSGIPRPAQK